MLMRKIGLLFGLLVLAAATRTVRLRAFEQHQRGERYEDIYYLPPADWLPVLSLGYTAALADLLWCRSLVYFGEELGQRGQVKHLFNYTEAIVTLDPDLKEAYTWAATGAMYRASDPTPEEGFRALNYLRKAVERWPNDGALRWEMGSFMRYELMPLIKDPAQKLKIDQEAATHLHVAGLKGAGPAWLALNNAKLLTKLGHKEQAIRQLEEVYSTINDEDTRRDIARRLTKLRSETYAEALRAATADFEQRHRAAFPYLSADLFMLVGEKVAASHREAIATRFLPELQAPPLEGDAPSP